MREKQPRREIVNRPTRDLKETEYGRWQDAELPDDRVWSGGSRDFDERSGTYRPGHRDDDYKFTQTDKGRNRERRRPEQKRDWWQEPRRDYRPEKTSKERRMELLTGGTGTGGSSYSDRQSLLTGRGLSSNEDRMAMLTGRSDPPKEKWQSQYGGRREYDPQDREFNRQFNTEPTANRDVLSQFRTEGSTGGYPVPTVKDRVDHMKSGYDQGGDIQREIGEWTGIKGDVPRNVGEDPTSSKPKQYWEGGRKYEIIPATFNDNYYGEGKRGMVAPEMRTEITPQAKYDDSSVRERLRALEGRPQSTGGGWQEDRIKALENRKPIVNQSTVDLSGVEGRLSQLEGKAPSWQEDRIAALEGKKPQDLSGIQGRLSELEGKAPSWQEDRISQLEGSRTQSKSARDLLDQRLASLENYYKNDPPPPPEESTGNRYEDKQAALNKMWEQTGNVYDPEAFAKGNTWQKTKDDPTPSWFTDERKAANDYVRNKDWYGTDANAQKNWAADLPGTYRKQMRDLDREYNKPSHSAIIKGREYTAYGPAAAARLKYLDQENIHEDEYLGHGTWENKFGEEITGRGTSGHEKRYFTSHSGLDPESEEYAKRFRRGTTLTGDDGEKTNYYKKQQAGTLTDNEKWWLNYKGGYKPEEMGKYGWGVVGTNKSKTGQTKWDEAYYPELG